MSDLEASKSSAAGPLILALDTSSPFTSLAIARGDRIIAALGTELSERRSERLWDQIDFLLGEAALKIDDVDLFAACAGPGGFTGLRVGIAAAKGFAAAMKKPAIGITSLEAVAFAARPAPAVCSVVNAYRGEVYAQLFSIGRDGTPIPVNEPLILRPEEVPGLVPKGEEAVFAGDGVDGVLASRTAAVEGWTIAKGSPFLADQIARLAFLKFLRGLGEGDTLRACYVRPSDAEIKLSLGRVRP